MTPWYALEVYNGDSAAYFLRYHGFNIEAPTYRRFFRHNRTKAILHRTLHLFPGYVFVKFDGDSNGWGQVTSISDVRGPVASEDEGPLSFPAGLVEQICFDARMGRYDERLVAQAGKTSEVSVSLRSFNELKKFINRPRTEKVPA